MYFIAAVIIAEEATLEYCSSNFMKLEKQKRNVFLYFLESFTCAVLTFQPSHPLELKCHACKIDDHAAFSTA